MGWRLSRGVARDDPGLPVAGRLDWLTLLPEVVRPEVVTLLGAALDHELDELAAHFAVDTVHRTLTAGLAVDVLVFRAESGLQEALGALASNGVAWVEYPAGWARCSRAVSRAARRSGLTVRAEYWTLPTLRRARRYVPLHHREAVRWYLDHLFAPNTRSQRVVRMAAMRWPALCRLLPGGVAGVLAGPDASDGLLADGDCTGVRPSESALIQSSAHDLGNRTIVVPFGADGAPTGSLLKVVSRWAMDDMTDAEFSTLGELHAELPPELAASIPVPLARWEWAGRRVTQESMFSGMTVAQAVADRRIDPEAALASVAEWVTAFHRATARSAVWDLERIDRLVRPLFGEFRSRYRPDMEVEQLLETAETRAVTLLGSRLPEVRRHFDLTPANVIVGDHGVAVIDWEAGAGRPASGRGLPVCDLDYFVKLWMHVVANAETLADELGLFPHLPGRLQETGRTVIANYCAALDIDPAFLPMLAVYQWTEQAVLDGRRAERLGGLPDQRQKAVHYVTVLARTQHQLFED